MRKGNRGEFKAKRVKPERGQKSVVDVHNEIVNGIIGRIVSPTVKAGGKQDDIMRLLESVAAGVIANIVAEGHEGEVLRVFHSHVLSRIVEIRQRKFRFDQDVALAAETRERNRVENEKKLKQWREQNGMEETSAVAVISTPKIVTG